MWKCRSHGSHGLSTTSRRAKAWSVRRAFAARFSLASMRANRTNLSLSSGLRLARLNPLADHSRSRWARDCSVSRLAL